MFPLLIVRNDLFSVRSPVTTRPNLSSVPGSPLSNTVTVKSQFAGFVAGPQTPQNVIDPSRFFEMPVTGPLTCRPVTWLR